MLLQYDGKPYLRVVQGLSHAQDRMNVKPKVTISDARKSIETSSLKMPSEQRKGLADYLCHSEGTRDKVYNKVYNYHKSLLLFIESICFTLICTQMITLSCLELLSNQSLHQRLSMIAKVIDYFVHVYKNNRPAVDVGITLLRLPSLVAQSSSQPLSTQPQLAEGNSKIVTTPPSVEPQLAEESSEIVTTPPREKVDDVKDPKPCKSPNLQEGKGYAKS
jgi:hypothetical protein